MIALVRCPNPDCGHESRVSDDPPGRVFRCPRCREKLCGGRAVRADPFASRLGRYQILGVLGEGQYARVYRAFDPVLERAVALKVLRPGLLRPDKMKERFLSESRALARLRHPRIVPVFEVGCAADVYFIAMALIEGESLAELRDRGAGPIDFRRAVEIIADLAEALAHAHRQGIVHRDVKPLNIRIDRAGQVYLMDFGIAYRPDSGDICVDGGKRTGTPAYVAPELARGTQPVILPASDQYSLGVVFYELLCGRPPFTGPPLYVLFQAANQKPPSPRSLDPTIPPRLAAICLKMLSKCPESRYSSCDDIATSLRRWLKGKNRPKKDVERGYPVPGRPYLILRS